MRQAEADLLGDEPTHHDPLHTQALSTQVIVELQRVLVLHQAEQFRARRAEFPPVTDRCLEKSPSDATSPPYGIYVQPPYVRDGSRAFAKEFSGDDANEPPRSRALSHQDCHCVALDEPAPLLRPLVVRQLKDRKDAAM